MLRGLIWRLAHFFALSFDLPLSKLFIPTNRLNGLLKLLLLFLHLDIPLAVAVILRTQIFLIIFISILLFLLFTLLSLSILLFKRIHKLRQK